MPLSAKIQLIKKERLNVNVFRFTCEAQEVAANAKAGQFINIKVADDTVGSMLRRPVSIYNIDRQNGNIEFIFQQRGVGTKLLAAKNVWDTLDIIGPLGRGFDIPTSSRIAIVGGGIGVFPLHQLAKDAIFKHNDVDVLLGFRDKELVLLKDEFEKYSNQLTICTDNGTYGRAGYVTEHLRCKIKTSKIDAIFACGPQSMLKLIKEISETNDIPCQISLEERMGCAIGACMGCAIKLNTEDDKVIKYGRVCKDGPVFNCRDVVISV